MNKSKVLLIVCAAWATALIGSQMPLHAAPMSKASGPSCQQSSRCKVADLSIELRRCNQARMYCQQMYGLNTAGYFRCCNIYRCPTF